MQTYLFDFDGTLVDSMPTYISAMLRILDENGITYGDDIIKIITPLGVNGTAEYYLQLGVPLSKEQIIEKMKAYVMEGYFYTIQAKEHVIPVLQQLKAVEQEHPEVVLTVFVPDAWKEGGAYEQICGNLKRIDPVEGTLVLTDLRQVKLERIRKISSGGLKG